MIFEDLLNLWKRSDLLSQAISDTHEMLSISFNFYEFVSSAILDEEAAEKLDKELVKKKDYLLNHFERSIRKKSFEHMSLSEKKDQNLYYGIVLITVTGDIERIGDYCKNLYEVVELREKLTNAGLNSKRDSYLKDIKEMFENTKVAFCETSKKTAEKVINKHFEIKTSIDEKLLEITVSETKENLVIYALLFRYLKRISSHLRNICTSISNPIDEIGFYTERD
jgi:phosphate uptake regulator